MFRVRVLPHTLKFKFPAGTSRGILQEKTSWYFQLEQGGKYGLGEAGPLPGLSIDDREDFPKKMREVGAALEKVKPPLNEEEVYDLALSLCGEAFPSIRFALETALLDWLNEGKRCIFNNSFYEGNEAIPINGLIWMGDQDTMLQRMQQKLEEGYRCIKMKIGGIRFEEECAILAGLRKHYGPNQITLRVDANGAFSPKEAPEKLEKLSEYQLHSIEQPIKAGQADHMRKLCRSSPVPVALDEELIGISVEKEGKKLLEHIRPQYIILKPGLLGGFAATRRWIELAEGEGIGWWITSALESNIGLNAISQFTAQMKAKLPQGLGTGQLYHNNIPSPLRIEKGTLLYKAEETWKTDPVFS